MKLKDLAKVELHLHLDGSLNLADLSKRLGLSEEDVADKLQSNGRDKSLKDYLKRFELSIEVLQDKETLFLMTKKLLEDLIEDNVIYAEIRFAPLLHTKTMTTEEVIETVLSALESEKIKTGLILCMMRHHSLKENKQLIDLAAKYANLGVVAVDLAGSESEYPLDEFKSLFDYANELSVSYTIHAGEAASYESVDTAILMGSKRIGHGIRSIESLSTINRLLKNNVCLEICPTSNLDTKVVESYDQHPIKEIARLGIKYCINTDNKTVSNISLTEEYQRLIDNKLLSLKQIIESNKTAIKASFLSDKEKEKLLKDYETRLVKFAEKL